MSVAIRVQRPVVFLITFFAALCSGLFIMQYVGMTARWVVSFSTALIIFFIGISLKNPKTFFLALFAFALPVHAVNYIGQLSSAHTGGPAGFYNTFLDLPLFILYILWLPELFVAKTSRIRFTKLDASLCGVIAMACVSMYNAAHIKLCLYSIVQLIKVYLIYLYFANAVRTRREVNYIILFVLIGVFFEGILGVLQYVKGSTFGLDLLGGRYEMKIFADLSRVSGTLGHPNDFAAYVGFFLPLALALLLAPIQRHYKIMCGALLVIGTSAVVLTLSRGGWVAFVSSLGMLLLLAFHAKIFSFRRVIAIVLVCVVAAAVVFFAFQELIVTRLFSDDYGSAWSRIPQVKVALNVIRAHPLIGIGINNYAEVMHLYDNTPERITSVVTFGLHNSYLLIAGEIGIIGLWFFVQFILLLFYRGMKAIRKNTTVDSYIIIGFLAGIAAFLISIAVEPVDLARPNFVCFWMISGLIVAITGRNKGVSEEMIS